MNNGPIHNFNQYEHEFNEMISYLIKFANHKESHPKLLRCETCDEMLKNSPLTNKQDKYQIGYIIEHLHDKIKCGICGKYDNGSKMITARENEKNIYHGIIMHKDCYFVKTMHTLWDSDNYNCECCGYSLKDGKRCSDCSKLFHTECLEDKMCWNCKHEISECK